MWRTSAGPSERQSACVPFFPCAMQALRDLPPCAMLALSHLYLCASECLRGAQRCVLECVHDTRQ